MERLDKIKGQLLFLGVLAVFFSKGAFNIIYGLLGLVGIFRTVLLLKNKIRSSKKIKEIFKMHKYDRLVLILLMSIPIGVLANFISSGVEGVKFFLKEEAYIYTIVLLGMLDFKESDYYKCNIGILIGSVVSSIYTIIGNFNNKVFQSNINFGRRGRMGSFQNQIRFGGLLSGAIPLTYAAIFSEKKLKKILLISSLIILLTASLLNGGRSTWVSFVFTTILFTFVEVKSKEKRERRNIVLSLILFFSLLGLTIKSNPGIYKRAKSIFDFNISNPLESHSESVRLGFIKVGIDMAIEKPLTGFGGMDKAKSINSYIDSKSDEYKKDYLGDYIKSPFATPFENSYVNDLVGNGIPYTIFTHVTFISLVVYFLYLIKKKERNEENSEEKEKMKKKVTIANVITMLIIGVKIYFFFFPGWDRYIEFLNYIELFYLKELAKDNT